METNLLDRILNDYLAEQTTVTITLQNKISISGKIKAFDSYIIVMDGQKRGIVYRHAVSCMTAHPLEKQKIRESAVKQPPVNPSVKIAKSSSQKAKHRAPLTALTPSAGESSINTGMKEGLLRWMREQKAAK